MREQQPSTLSRSARLNQRAVETSPSSQKDALINKKIDTHPLKSAEQNVRLQVLNAIDQVENSKAMVQLYQSTGLLLDERGIAVRSVLRLTGGAPKASREAV